MSHHEMLLTVMLTYMLVITLLGMYVGRKVKSSSDYAIAGRNLPGWAAALSERATGESAWALLGLPGAAYALGLTELWTAIGCVSGILLGWIFIASRLRSEAEKYNAVSFMEYIAKRHGAVGQYMQITGSLIIAFFFFFYVGAQFIGGGKTIHELFGLNLTTGILILFVFVVPYTIYGGFQSVVYTDVIQAILMLITLVVGPIVGFFYLANNSAVVSGSIYEALSNAGPEYVSFTGTAKGFGAGVIIVSGFSWMFGYLGGMPQLATRFMAIKNQKEAIKGRNIGIVWTVFAYTGALLLGWIGLAIFGPETITDRETVMPAVIMRIFPPVIAAILITGAFAAMISTANSLLILSATEISENIQTGKSRNSRMTPLKRSRLITTILSVMALIFAIISRENLIYDIVKYVWAGIGDTFSVVIILSLYWKKFHAKAAFLTIIAGILFTIIWIQSGMEQYISCLILTFVVSLLTAIIATHLIAHSPNQEFKHEVKS
jgi:sodium/proline symporter